LVCRCRAGSRPRYATARCSARMENVGGFAGMSGWRSHQLSVDRTDN
jgi:hypothetical protein